MSYEQAQTVALALLRRDWEPSVVAEARELVEKDHSEDLLLELSNASGFSDADSSVAKVMTLLESLAEVDFVAAGTS